MHPALVIDTLRQSGSFREGHFVFTAEAQPHSEFYIDCASALRRPNVAQEFGKAMAHRIIGMAPEIIVTPAENAIPLGVPTASYLQKCGHVPSVLAVIASKGPNKTFTFKRGADKLLAGKRVAVLEDLWSTGSSTRSVVTEIQRLNGEVVAVGAIVNRGNVTAQDIGEVGAFFSLCEVDGVPHIPTPENPCPWCEQRIPMNTDYGHGAEWLKQHPDYPVAH